MSKLKPCPFCGGEGIIVRNFEGNLISVACTGNDYFTLNYHTIEEAVLAWNNGECENAIQHEESRQYAMGYAEGKQKSRVEFMVDCCSCSENRKRQNLKEREEKYYEGYDAGFAAGVRSVKEGSVPEINTEPLKLVRCNECALSWCPSGTGLRCRHFENIVDGIAYYVDDDGFCSHGRYRNPDQDFTNHRARRITKEDNYLNIIGHACKLMANKFNACPNELFGDDEFYCVYEGCDSSKYTTCWYRYFQKLDNEDLEKDFWSWRI